MTQQTARPYLPLSPRALELLSAVFNEKSNVQLPVGTARQIVEIQDWLTAQVPPPPPPPPPPHPAALTRAKRKKLANRPKSKRG